MMNPNDEQNIRDLLQDEGTRRAGFELLVRCYGRQLYWHIRRMVLLHDDANDLLQDTFAKAWMGIGSFRGEAQLSTWLYRIATNECLSFLEKKQARNMVSMDDVGAGEVYRLESDPYFSGDEAELKFQQAILTLPAKQRMVFNMKYYQDMKYEEISAVVGTSVGALKADYHHAVKKIEKILCGEN